MSKKSKKRKRRRLSSSSVEEDEKASEEQAETNKCKTDKGNQDLKSQESCAVSSAINDLRSTRQIKKPVYRVAKTQATDQKAVNKDKDCTKAKSVSLQIYRENSSSKAKHNISGKDNTVSGSKSVEKEHSKPSSTTGTILQRTEKTSTVSLDEESSQGSSSKLKKQLMSPSLASAEQKEQKYNVPKKKCRAKEPQRPEHDSNSIKTREPSKASSISKDSSRQKKSEPVKNICQKHQEEECKAKKILCTDAQIPSPSITKQPSALAKQTTSESSSKVLKNVVSIPWSVASASHKAAWSSPPQQMCSHTSPQLQKFKIPKKALPRPVDSTEGNKNVISKNINIKHETKVLDSEVSVRSTQGNVQQPCRCLESTSSFSLEGQDKRSSGSGQLPTVSSTATEPWCDQMQVVEELHLARSQKRLGVNVMQSYGKLTCMDIDTPEEDASISKQAPQEELILVLDTNILLSHLNYVKKIKSHGLGALGFPVVLIPWVVLQELDSLKRGKGLSGSVAHLATPAISYIYNCLKSREPYLWGQSMQQAAESTYGLNGENNDDRVLQCCLQYQRLYPGCALILCTNDKNLCSKALLSGVKALSKNDLEAEAGKSRDVHHLLQKLHNPMLTHTNPQISSPSLRRTSESVQQHCQGRTGLSPGFMERDGQQLNEDKKTRWDLSRCVSELEDCLQEVLSDVLEAEMKAAYEDLWLEIVYVKPPWTLQDVLQCLKKHWIAVFGHIVPRRKQQTVLNLIDFFNSGKTMNCSALLVALQEANDLVKAFGKSSSRVPSAISVMDNIFNKLQSQGESPAGDVVMNDDDEDKQPTPAQVSHQEVWALFENIWSNVCQISLEVFKALGFDPHTMQSAHPVQGPLPPQEALACLHKLSSMVSQLLQAFSSVLSPAPGLEDVQSLLSVIHSNKIVDVDSRLTARDLLDCFSQQDYREKLRVGGNQLIEVKETLDRCVEATGQNIPFTT